MGSKNWDKHSETYRTHEMGTVAKWIEAGESGTVVGLAGVGKATFLSFLCHHPTALKSYVGGGHKILLVPVDLNDMPDDTLSTFYRIILRAFYEVQGKMEQSWQRSVEDVYRRYEAATDPFLPQSAIRELLSMFEDEDVRVVWVLNHFDEFGVTATSRMMNTLHALRDSFKQMLCFVVGVNQELRYLTELEPSPLYGVLDSYVCFVRPLNRADSENMIERRSQKSASPEDVDKIFQLTGGYTSLLRIACRHWLEADEGTGRGKKLFEREDLQERLKRIWEGLTSEEQFCLSTLQKKLDLKAKVAEMKRFAQEQEKVLARLVDKGVCENGGKNGRYHIVSEWLIEYIRDVANLSRGRIWQDKETGLIYQGTQELAGLTPTQKTILSFLIANPRMQHTHSELTEIGWPEVAVLEGVSPDSLYQAMSNIRRIIEPDRRRPNYLVNWRGNPEGGYQFFPEGRPKS